MITVGLPYLPDRKKLETYLDRVYESRWLTNNGPLVQELERRLADFLGVENLLLVANGTLALQVAIRALGITGDVVTTPFTFAATSAAIRNECLGIRYSDIDGGTLNLDPGKAELACGPQTEAVVPVHVYGNPCEVERFEMLAQSRGLKTVYDAAHALGVNYDGGSLLRWGDAATLSLHATKLFHTGEGGAVVFRREEDMQHARRLINFGLDPASGSIPDVGMNAKLSEFNAAVGLAMLEDLPTILERRKAVAETYERMLADWVTFPCWCERATKNGAYAPILLENSLARDKVQTALKAGNVGARPYFTPSLDTAVAYGSDDPLPTAAEKAEQALCLPVSPDIGTKTAEDIASLVKKGLMA